MKTCSNCKKKFSENHFYPKQNQCKACKYRQEVARREERKKAGQCTLCNKPVNDVTKTECSDCRYKKWLKTGTIKEKSKIEKIADASPPGTKYCSGCEKYLPLDTFYKWDDRKVSRCKKCKRSATACRHSRLKTERKCLGCEKPLKRKEKSLCKNCKARAREKYHANGDQNRAASRERAFQLKLATFDAYGGCICKCCEETEPMFLTIDHINEDGAAHRQSLGGKHMAGKHFYNWLKKNNYPPGFQVLCFNCNFAKGHFGICPHEQNKLSIAAG